MKIVSNLTGNISSGMIPPLPPEVDMMTPEEAKLSYPHDEQPNEDPAGTPARPRKRCRS